MASPHFPVPGLGQGARNSRSASVKTTNLESLLADIHNGTANVLPHHFVEPTATPEIVSTTPALAPNKKQHNRKRTVLQDRAANDRGPPRKEVQVQGNGDDDDGKGLEHLKRAIARARAINDSSPPRQKFKAHGQDDKENDDKEDHDKESDDKQNERTKNLSPQNDLSPPRKTFKPQGQDDNGVKETKRTNSLFPQANDVTTTESKQMKQQKPAKHQDEQQDQPRTQTQEYVPRQFYDTESQKWWTDCGYCRGKGGEYEDRPWTEHDREGANKRVDAHNKNIKIKCIHCRFYYKQYGMIGCRPGP